MKLETVEVQGFRNLRGRIACAGGLNILLGENGHGKTNWLESIYVLATTKSFRTARLQEAIAFGEDLAIVRGEVRQSAEILHDLQIAISGNTKALSITVKKSRFSGIFANCTPSCSTQTSWR
jgi:DNA replication and repair protein RecF